MLGQVGHLAVERTAADWEIGGDGAVGSVFAREGGELRAPSSSVHQSASYLSR